MAQNIRTLVKNSISSILVGLVTFVTLTAAVSPEPVEAASKNFITAEALSGFGFASADQFKSALVTNCVAHLNNDYYPNGCIDYVMYMYRETLNMYGGPQASSPHYAEALAVANSFVNDAGTQWATVAGFATDPQLNAITGGIVMSPINNDLSGRLSEYGASQGDIIILGGGHTSEDAYKCSVRYTTSPSSTSYQYQYFNGYASASACKQAALNWCSSHNPSTGYYNARISDPEQYDVSVASREYGHIAVYQGSGTAVWQATFSYSSNTGSTAFATNLGNSSTGSKAYQNVCVLKIAGNSTITPTPTPGEGSPTTAFHAAGGKVILVSEWNDLVAAYGESYVRSNVSFEIFVNQACEIVTDIGPDGVYGIGPGADGKYGDQYYYGSDGTTKVGPDGIAGNADDNTTYNDDIRDDVYYTVAAGQVLWSGDLTGITPTTITIGDYTYYEFALPNVPTDGMFMKINDTDPDISITIRETGAFNALFPG